MRKWAGEKVYELMWEPLMIGKFGERYAKTGQHGLDVGAAQGAHHPPGHLRGRLPGVRGPVSPPRLRRMGVTIRLSTPVEPHHGLAPRAG